MEQQQPSEGIVRKIQNLLSLAARAEGNEEEASAAMAMAQKLLAKYNLDYYQVQQAQVAGGTNVVEEKREKTLIGYSAMYRWQRELWKAIAEANFCWHWVVERRVPHRRKKDKMVTAKRHMLLGRESNVMAVRLMGEYLCDTLERILPYPNAERLSRSAISWREGCADRLAERITEQARKARQQATGNTTEENSAALVMKSMAEKEYAANYDAKYGKGAHARQLEWEAGAAERNAKWEAEQRARQEKEEAEWLEYLQTETPEQKKKRERLEEKQRIAEESRREREGARWRNRYWKEQEKEARRLDHSAYSAGHKAGDSVNLSKQAASGQPTKELK